MRVGFIIYGSLETRSGGFLYDRKLVAYLRSQGDDVQVFSLPWKSYPRHLLQNADRRWLDTLARAPLDILIQDELNHPSLFWLNRRLKARARYPIVTIVHHLRSDEAHPWPLLPFYRAIEARYLCSVDGFICNSQATRASVLAMAGEGKPTIVAHPGREAHPPPLHQADIRMRAQEPGPLRLLFVGNIIPRKGLHTLLSALARLPDHVALLTLIGDHRVDDRYSQRLRKQAQRLNLEGRVHWAGPVSDVELAQAYAHHHALVAPSQYEGFGIVYLEAMAYGLIAVGTEAGGAGEVIRPGETGLLIPPGDADALAGKLLWLATHRAEMAEMGIAARRVWMAHPTWEETGARIRDFLAGMSSQR